MSHLEVRDLEREDGKGDVTGSEHRKDTHFNETPQNRNRKNNGERLDKHERAVKLMWHSCDTLL